MITKELQKKVDMAIRLLQSAAPKDGSPIEVAYSGGKDSDVILQLVKESGIPYRAIYKNTTIDPPGTISHVREMGVEILQPNLSFFKLIEKNGLPSRLYRFCCSTLKEYKVLDRVVLGVRREESPKRAARYNEPTACRVYGKNERVEQFYPIFYWTLDDVTAYIQDRGIRCAPVYYDEQGIFHPERRLGCICCPLATRHKRIEDFKRYPNMIKLYIRHAQKFLNSHPNSKIKENNKDAYGWFVRELFCDKKEEWDSIHNGLFGRPDYKALIEDKFNISL